MEKIIFTFLFIYTFLICFFSYEIADSKTSKISLLFKTYYNNVYISLKVP